MSDGSGGSWTGWQDAEARPIFLVGAPRSGTTLLRALLNRHSAIGLCDETYFFYWVWSRRRHFGDLRVEANRARLVDRYLATGRVRRLGLDLDRLRERLLPNAWDAGLLFATLFQAYAEAQGKARSGEKTPEHALFAKDLLRIFPGAYLVHLVRDPRDVVASLLRMPWSASTALGAALRWRDCVAAVEDLEDRSRVRTLHYEQLVAGPESTLRDLLEFLGEPYEPGLLESREEAPADRWWFERAHGPVTQTRREKWREELSQTQIDVVEWIAGPLMDRLGYEREGSPPAAVVRWRARAAHALDMLHQRLTTLPRLWYHWIQPTHLASEERWVDRRANASRAASP